MATDLTPKRIKDGDAVPTVPSTLVLPCDQTDFAKGYKITIEQLTGYGRVTVDCTWNLRSAWYSPDISMPFKASSFLGFESQAFFDDEGNAYSLPLVYDAPLQNFDYRELDQEWKKVVELFSRRGFSVQIQYYKSTNVVRAQYFYPYSGRGYAVTNIDAGLEATSGVWGTRYANNPETCLHSGCLAKFKNINTPRMRLVLRYSVPLDEA